MLSGCATNAGIPANIRHRDLASTPSDSVEDIRPDKGE